MRVIFHGDDFGLTHGANQGILDAFSGGLLKSASLMAGGLAFDEASALARQNPGLDVGVHLVLCDEPPLTRTSLIYRGTRQEARLPSRNVLARAIVLKKLNMDAVEAEWRAQIEKVINAGLLPSHLDSHQFVHLFPGLFPLSLKLAREYRIRFVRTRDLEPLAFSAPAGRLAQWRMLQAWIAAYAAPRADFSLCRVPCTGFVLAGGRFTSALLARTLTRLAHLDVLEIFSHPAVPDQQTQELYHHWKYHWENDRAMLLAPESREAVQRAGALVTSFSELGS